MSVYVGSESTATSLVVGLYSDRGGHPGNLLAGGVNPSPTAGAWNQVALDSSPSVSSGSTYWVVLLGLGGRLAFRDENPGTANCSEISAEGDLTSLPATWTSGPRWTTCSASAYISETTSGSSASPAAGTQTLNCFSSPMACGYPDPAAPVGDRAYVGPSVSCSSLTPSGSVTTSSNGQTIQDVNISGMLTIVNSNVTVNNVCVTANGGGNLGSSAVRINSGVTGTVIKNARIGGANTSNGSVEMAVYNTSENPSTIDHSYLFNCGECVHDDSWTLSNSYVISNGMTGTSDHVETVYISDGSFTGLHDTFIDPPTSAPHAANLFGNAGGGSGGPCNNHWILKNSLIAGGTQVFQFCAHSSGVGGSTMDVESNHFARCSTAPIVTTSAGGLACHGYTGDQTDAADGRDSHGFWPNVGYFGLHDATVYCGANSSQIWTGNVYDDNGAGVDC
jgi:hypothetical protein